MLWDRGYWAPEKGFENIGAALAKGELKFVMEGERMHGSWVIVRLKGDGRGKPKNAWLLIKHRDEGAVEGNVTGPTDADRSVASKRTMTEIAAGTGKAATPFMTAAGAKAGAVWQSNRADASDPVGRTARRRKGRCRRPSASAVATIPAFIEPQLATMVDKPPAGPGWAHEIKFDGYRMQLRVDGGAATLLSRKGLDWSAKFPEIVASAATSHRRDHRRRGRRPRPYGRSRLLRHCRPPSRAARPRTWCSLPSTNCLTERDDLRPQPLSERKVALAAYLAEAGGNLRYVDHFVTAGDAVLLSACRMDLEGIVSKKLDAPYVSGRSESWAKSKCRQGHEVVIGGWTTTGDAFRSLIAGVYRDGELVHVGRIGTGFGRDVVAKLMPRLEALKSDTSPFKG